MVKGKSIGVISIKGGVGKTSVVANLGSILAKEFNKKVLVVDANFSAPNLNLHFGLVNPLVTLENVLYHNVNALNSLYKHDSGVHILPCSPIRRKISPTQLKRRIAPLKKHYDLILIDSSPSLNEEMAATMLASDELLVVTAPDYVTLSCTLHAVKVAKQKNTPISGIIINRVRGKKFELSVEEIESITGIPVISTLSEDVKVIEALSHVTPATLVSPFSSASIGYKKLAASLVGEEYKDPRFFFRLKNQYIDGLLKKFKK